MTEKERNLGSLWFEEVWNKRRRDAIAELLAHDAVIHDGGKDASGPEGFYQFYDLMQAAFSNLHVTVLDTIAERDRVCVRWSCRAAHTGHGLGMPPTGKTVHVTGVSIVRVADGRAAEVWQNWDMMGLMEQIQERARSATYIA
jgi:steroid delta-isomerase-like uncharacterized protein